MRALTTRKSFKVLPKSKIEQFTGHISDDQYKEITSCLQQIVTEDSIDADDTFDILVNYLQGDDELALDLLEASYETEIVEPYYASSYKSKMADMSDEKQRRRRAEVAKKRRSIMMPYFNNIWMSEARFNLIKTKYCWIQTSDAIGSVLRELKALKKKISTFYRKDDNGNVINADWYTTRKLKDEYTLKKAELKHLENRNKRLKTHIKEWERAYQLEGY